MTKRIIKMKTENIKIKTNPKFNENYYSKLSQCSKIGSTG